MEPDQSNEDQPATIAFFNAVRAGIALARTEPIHLMAYVYRNTREEWKVCTEEEEIPDLISSRTEGILLVESNGEINLITGIPGVTTAEQSR